MAIKTHTIVQTTTVDDLDGTTGADVKTRTFSLGSDCYEIELSEQNWADTREALADVIAKARTVKAGARKAASKAKRVPKADAAAVRERNLRIKEWGRANGFEVTVNGQPKKELVDAYEAAQAAPAVGVPEFVMPPQFVAA